MTEYRLLCIFEKNPIAHQRVRIEVNYDTKGKTLAPFLRKVSMTDMVGHVVPECCELYQLMEHCGFTTQPFYLPQIILTNYQVSDFLANYPYKYIQSSKGNSLKRGGVAIARSVQHTIPTGKILAGELYISNLNNIHFDCAVRFRYSGAFCEFFPKYINLPYVSIDNELYVRDRLGEERWLGMLPESYYDSLQGTINLKNTEIEKLQSFIQNGWHVYVQRTLQTRSRVYAHQNTAGIVWFSTQENVENEEITKALLDAYIHHRNYQQIGDKMVLCNNRDIEKIEDKEVLACWQLPEHTRNLYDTVHLTEQEELDYINNVRRQLRVSLYPYQEKGVAWLEEQRRNGHGCLLADEMGLGKTLQVIAYLTSRPASSRHLIVVPSSLVFNWRNEIDRFAPQIFNQVIIASYDIVRLHIDDYSKESYDTIVVDEVQMIKNSDTQRYSAITHLKGSQKIFLSGTPIENSVDELWAQFMVLIPEMKSMYSHVRSLDISSSQEEYVQLSAKLLKPFILRRTKSEVMLELPDKTEEVVYVDLSPVERQIYANLHSIISRALTTGLTGRINSLVLEGLLRLRQTCVSANMLPVSLRREKYVESSKMELVRSYIRQVRSSNKKTLVFSQFVSALKELETLLSEDKIEYTTLYGETYNRESVISTFKNNKEIPVMLMSLKAGGVGLNLTEADLVILLDDWWNPAVEEQAIARAHRIGQKNNVLVLRLVCKDTIEEKILQLQEKKRQTVDIFNKTNVSLSISELKELLS